MRQRVTRKFKRHFGATAKTVAVKSTRPWYWSTLLNFGLILLGYLIAYWQLAGGDFARMIDNLRNMAHENSQLLAKVVQNQRQLQVEQAAQNNLAKELVKLQDESIQQKEEIAFYKNILNEKDVANSVSINSFKITKGLQQYQYIYHILLVQSGRHDKMIQGNLKLNLKDKQSDKPLTFELSDGPNSIQPITVNFKYYQRIDGTFSIQKSVGSYAVEAAFFENGNIQPKVIQQVDLPI